jgi:heme oxygenase
VSTNVGKAVDSILNRAQVVEEQFMSEKKTAKTRNITFRVTNEEYEQIEKVAGEVAEDPNTWCRKIAVAASREGSGLAKNERLLYGEIARLRFLVGHGFKLLFGDEQSTAGAWKKFTIQAEQRGEEIVTELLSRRK